MAFRISSANFKDGDYLGNRHMLASDYGFGCNGENLSPQLSWMDAPLGTKGFALTCFDPDAPTGSGFWHWVVVNVPKDMMSIDLGAGGMKSGSLPAGALQTRTDFGAPGYGGPCPPAGDHPHRYLFSVFAVGVDKLPVEADTPAALVGFQLHLNSLAKASIMGLARR